MKMADLAPERACLLLLIVEIMFKSLAYLSLTASAVTLYVHVRNHDLHLSHFGRSTPEPVETKKPGEIVVAPFHGNTLSDRWQGDSSRR
jgi:hypothetical protein